MNKLSLGINLGHFEESTRLIPNNWPNYNLMYQLKLNQFAALRFMDWQKTNNSNVKEYWDLPRYYDQRWMYWGGPWRNFHGVPLKYLVDIANRMQSRPWICIPHKASPECMRRMVQFVIAGARQRPIFELSNETWNSQFSQYWYNVRQGMMSAMAFRPTTAALRWQSHRTASLAAIVGKHGDVVISGQTANPWIAEQLISAKALRGKIAAIAIAPYFGQRVTQTTNLFNTLKAEIEGPLRQNIRAHHAVAQKYGVKLWGYEGGQHLVAKNAQQRNAFVALNRSGEMQRLTQQWLNIWFKEGGSLICPYSFSSRFGNHMWGHVEVVGDQFQIRPKYNALFSQ